MYGIEFDEREMARRRERWYESIDENTKTVKVRVYLNPDCEACDGEGCPECDEMLVEFPFTYEVCSLCGGKGTHVNPSIDAHGISADEFAEDPDFAEEYFSGAYDVACYECGGKRVVPEIDESRLDEEQKKALKALRDQQQRDHDYARICAAERAMGC